MVDAQFGLLKAQTQVLDALVGYFLASASYYRSSGNIWRFFNEALRNQIKRDKY